MSILLKRNVGELLLRGAHRHGIVFREVILLNVFGFL
jgi:hypothetical protein